MDKATLAELIQKGESFAVEFKVASPRPAEMAERLCGFANSAYGGLVVIGVTDKSWEAVGVKSTADAIDNLLQAARLCKPALPVPKPEIIELNSKALVVATVPPNNGTLYQAGGVYWLRRGTLTTPMETTEIRRFMYQQGQLNWELEIVPNATVEDLDMQRVYAYIDRISELTRRPARLSDPLEVLVRLKCLVMSEQAAMPILRPTNAGLLLFGYSPRELLNQAEIVMTYYQDNTGIRRYTDRKILTGTLPEQIEAAAELIKLWTPVGAYVEGFHRIDEPALPVEALREAIVNAVVHRDYSIEGTAVRLFYFPDRVELHNPGLLLPGITIDDLVHGRVGSQPRNNVIVSILRDMPGGYMERMGSGISFMINQMRLLGLPDPEFKQQLEFVVTFYKSSGRPAPIRAVPQIEISPVVTKVPLVAKDASKNRGRPAKPKRNLTTLTQLERQKLALDFIRENGYITNKAYRELTGASENTALRDLEMMVEQGLLRQTGVKRSSRYMF